LFRHDFSQKEIEMVKEYFEPVAFSKNTVIEEAGKVPDYLIILFPDI
jgi:hypothetical protein